MPQVKVLVVDDQEPFRRAMVAVVSETGGFVVVGTAGSGEESLELAAAVRPDLVLMDVNLPVMDGVEATRRLVGSADPPVVVLVSTYDEGAIDAHECGASAYITKASFGPERLKEAWATAQDGRVGGC